MRIEHWRCLNKDGTPNVTREAIGLKEAHGHVHIEPRIAMSADNAEGGCGRQDCHCSDGHWLSISFGINEITNIASGVTVFFDNWGEMCLFLINRELSQL